MRSITRLVIMFLAIAVTSFSLFTATNAGVTQNVTSTKIAPNDLSTIRVPATELFVLEKGKTLWVHFLAQKIPRHEWPTYWKDASMLSGIPHTEKAWRNLPVGMVITTPKTVSAVLVNNESIANAEVRQLTSTIDVLTALVIAAEKRIVAVDVKEAEVKFLLRRVYLIGGLLMLVFLFTYILVLSNVSQRKCKQKETEKAQELDELKSMRTVVPHEYNPHPFEERYDASVEDRAKVLGVPKKSSTPACCSNKEGGCDCGDSGGCCDTGSNDKCSCGEAALEKPDDTLKDTTPAKPPVNLDFKYYSDGENKPDK